MNCKKIYFRLLILFVCSLSFLIVSSTSINVVNADSLSSLYIVEQNALDVYIAETDINKTPNTKGELKTATYINNFLLDKNLSFWKGKESFVVEFTTGINELSYNVIAVKKSAEPTEKTIILGAHYDNLYNSTGAVGALNNATGVVCLMGLITKMKDLNLPYNLVYCFFSSTESGLKGSNNFLSNYSTDEKKNLLLYINFDSIGCGEHTYYYAGETANSFTKEFNFNAYSIKNTPTNYKADFLTASNMLAYSHRGLSGDCINFTKEKIKNINFFSGNYKGLNAGFRESATKENISNTPLDNLEQLTKNYPDYINKINDVALVTYNALINTNLVNAIEKSYTEIDFSFLNNKLVIAGIGIVGILMLCSISTSKIKMKKNYKKGR